MLNYAHLLLLSATPFELQTTLPYLRQKATRTQENMLTVDGRQIEIMFTGVGPVATAYALGKRFGSGDRLPDAALQVGIGGAIDRALPLGQAVSINSDGFGDVGAQDADGSWLSLGDLGFGPEEETFLLPKASELGLPTAAGVTVAQTTGTAGRLEQLRGRWPAARVETMEGAAFVAACHDAGIVPYQIRTISNYVGVRDREGWEIGPALDALGEVLQRLL